MAAASDQQTSSPAQAASKAAASAQAPSRASTQAESVQTTSASASVADAVDPRPKPRQSTSFILASGLSRDDLTKLTAQGFHVETRTQGRITPQVVRLRIPQGASLTQARQNDPSGRCPGLSGFRSLLLSR